MTPAAQSGMPESSLVIRDRIVDRLDELMEPREVRTKQWVHEVGVEHLVPREARTRMPSLLAQLGSTVPGSSTGVGSSGPGSRPPASLEATDVLRVITREARVMAGQMLALKVDAAMPGVRVVAQPASLLDALRVIRQFVPDLDRDSLLFVDVRVRSWWVHARVTTTWDSAPMKPFVPCPHCGVRGRMQVVTDPPAIACLACGEVWDAALASDLPDAFRLATAATAAAGEGG